ncbi:MAG: transaldolase family protein [Fibrobacteria bacterium]|nr:transaldolase family protein [Fibrobacteria bacterium]
MNQNQNRVNKIHEFILHEFSTTARVTPVSPTEAPVWARVVNSGSTLWLDTGDIDEATTLWNRSFSALTTNNTLLNNEIQKGIYDGLIKKAAAFLQAEGLVEKDMILEIAFILNAFHALQLVHCFGVKVSVELHTDLAHDAEASVAYAKRYYRLNPKNFIIKLPLTPAGFVAVRQLSELGIPVNYTLGFSARQNYLAARYANPSYVNVFMGRLNAFVMDNKLGDGDNVGEKTTMATQHILQALRENGQSITRLIGASIRSGQQIADVIGCDVLTIPPKAAAQYRLANPATAENKVHHEFPVSVAGGVTLEQFNASTLWDIPDRFKNSVTGLLAKKEAVGTASEFREYFFASGFGDLFPEWSHQEMQIISRDGKIPVYETWKSRLETGELGLDALMNISALCSFASDQAKLDQRIQSFL